MISPPLPSPEPNLACLACLAFATVFNFLPSYVRLEFPPLPLTSLVFHTTPGPLPSCCFFFIGRLSCPTLFNPVFLLLLIQ